MRCRNLNRLIRPHLVGWFVGQVMKKLNGAADPQEVYKKVAVAFGVEA
jgi:Asp-tRNA(Asn)/Glu-tRNA(Gln) amidotransferase B subunit